MLQFLAKTLVGCRPTFPRRSLRRTEILAIAAAAAFLLQRLGARPLLADPFPRPNVILIVADDQGYGDLSCHGNPALRTPNLDRLYAESVRLTDFHVAPMCSPTRGQLMTGRDAMKTGCTAVCQGRSMIRSDIPTMADFFQAAGYATGHFGKWHLGDSYPHRPQDRGFQATIHHRAWGITSLADYCDNRGGLTSATARGYWNVRVDQKGIFELELRRWPRESNKMLTEGYRGPAAKDRSARPITAANVQVSGKNYTLDAATGSQHVRFRIPLSAGEQQLATTFLDNNDHPLCSAIYVYLKRVADDVQDPRLTPESDRVPVVAVRRTPPVKQEGAATSAKQVFAGQAVSSLPDREEDVCGERKPARSSIGQRPNILWIVGENFSNDLGCYGQPNVATPHLDALAAQGVRYTNAFATSPVCAPSRSCFMLGMYQTTTDTHNMRSHRDDNFRLPPGIRPLTQRLKEVGYFTANVTHLGEEVTGTGKLDLNFVNEGKLYDSSQWDELAAHQPFFAQINLPEAEYDIYDRKSAAKQRVPWVGEDWHPQIATPDNVTPPPYYPDHLIVRQEWARYLNSISGADVRVGKILRRLEADGLDDDTVVIFFADNGRLTARGIHWPFDPGLRVPLIVRGAKNFPVLTEREAPGSVSSRVVSLLDLTATTMAIAGIERPLGMQSRVFVGDQADPPRTYAFAARDRIDETVVRMRSVHDERFHYVRNYTPGAGFETLNRYKEKCFLVKPLMRQLKAAGQLQGPALELMKPFPDEMLFDTKNDRHEIHNLATSDDPEHVQALLRLRAALDSWIVETGDRGHLLEPPEVVAPFRQEMHDWFGTPAWVRESD